MFNQDYKEILQLLIKEGVEFQVVGAYALAAHGYPRATGDIDIWIEATSDNAAAVYRSLAQFGAPISTLTPEDLIADGTVFQIGIAPCRIDILNRIDGVSYQESKSDKHCVTLDGLTIPFLSKKHLIQNKLSTGRLRDKADIEELLKQDLDPDGDGGDAVR